MTNTIATSQHNQTLNNCIFLPCFCDSQVSLSLFLSWHIWSNFKPNGPLVDSRNSTTTLLNFPPPPNKTQQRMEGPKILKIYQLFLLWYKVGPLWDRQKCGEFGIFYFWLLQWLSMDPWTQMSQRKLFTLEGLCMNLRHLSFLLKALLFSWSFACSTS